MKHTRIKLNKFWEILYVDQNTIILVDATSSHYKLKDINRAVKSFFEAIEKYEYLDLVLMNENKYDFESESFLQLIDKLININFFVESYSNEFFSQQERVRFESLINWFDSFNDIDSNTAFRRLRNAKVAILGMGGAGSLCAKLLTSVGIGKLILIDGDYVSESNLVRQPLYNLTQVKSKTSKIDAITEFLTSFSTFTELETHKTNITCEEDLEKLILEADVLISTADTPRIIINRICNNLCTKNEIPFIYSFMGQVGPFYIPNKSSCFNCLEESWREEIGEDHDIIVNAYATKGRHEYPSMINGPYLIAYSMFNEVFNFISGVGKVSTINCVLKVNDLGDVSKKKIQRNHNCLKCAR